ncbi:MAG: nucleotidyltransferase domain-containing protein [Deinococcota bacterium]|jgi:predicted nucleotidyltransferase|nr:nucleotidyltransferase domain-containing protein [Deinococcota bacterium]
MAGVRAKRDALSPRLRELLRALRLTLSEVYGADLEDLVLFGSEARGDAHDGSDVDVIVVLRRSVEPGAEIGRLGDVLAELNLRYSRLVTLVPASATQYRQAQDPFWRNVREEGIPV